MEELGAGWRPRDADDLRLTIWRTGSLTQQRAWRRTGHGSGQGGRPSRSRREGEDDEGEAEVVRGCDGFFFLCYQFHLRGRAATDSQNAEEACLISRDVEIWNINEAKYAQKYAQKSTG